MNENNETAAVGFSNLVDLASETFGGTALWATDEFFAEKENLLKPGRGVFVPGKFTDRGKWMDGWESSRTRRRSHSQDNDSCIIRLGTRGLVYGFDIDTNHFLGNHPPFASIEGLNVAYETSLEKLQSATWTPLLGEERLLPGSQNLFVVPQPAICSHVRLNIFPDGGVARFRVFGNVDPRGLRAPQLDEEARNHVAEGELDLVAARNGGRALATSDMFFGPMHNLILPGRAINMGEGWETRRRRSPGLDWILLQLGLPGTVSMFEVDTLHFRGNNPDDVRIEGINAPNTRITELVSERSSWTELVPKTPLSPHTRHWLRKEIVAKPPISHLRVSIYPDGGISRFRAWGHSN